MSGLRQTLIAAYEERDGFPLETHHSELADFAIATFLQWLADDEAVWLRVAAVLDPLAFDPDPHVRHRHCSPVGVDAVQGEALRRAKHLLVEIAAAPDALGEK